MDLASVIIATPYVLVLLAVVGVMVWALNLIVPFVFKIVWYVFLTFCALGILALMFA
jgi:hypothetical protein